MCLSRFFRMPLLCLLLRLEKQSQIHARRRFVRFSPRPPLPLIHMVGHVPTAFTYFFSTSAPSRPHRRLDHSKIMISGASSFFFHFSISLPKIMQIYVNQPFSLLLLFFFSYCKIGSTKEKKKNLGFLSSLFPSKIRRRASSQPHFVPCFGILSNEVDSIFFVFVIFQPFFLLSALKDSVFPDFIFYFLFFYFSSHHALCYMFHA
ncbi:hypothetical protein ACP275_14G295200 [Erythranthe tilingii]